MDGNINQGLNDDKKQIKLADQWRKTRWVSSWEWLNEDGLEHHKEVWNIKNASGIWKHNSVVEQGTNDDEKQVEFIIGADIAWDECLCMSISKLRTKLYEKHFDINALIENKWSQQSGKICVKHSEQQWSWQL